MHTIQTFFCFYWLAQASGPCVEADTILRPRNHIAVKIYRQCSMKSRAQNEVAAQITSWRAHCHRQNQWKRKQMQQKQHFYGSGSSKGKINRSNQQMQKEQYFFRSGNISSIGLINGSVGRSGNKNHCFRHSGLRAFPPFRALNLASGIPQNLDHQWPGLLGLKHLNHILQGQKH